MIVIPPIASYEVREDLIPGMWFISTDADGVRRAIVSPDMAPYFAELMDRPANPQGLFP